jgi:Rps23 Pro-64 3,4-dihydroxylase Tpa1-like proline 4-hydroxylase
MHEVLPIKCDSKQFQDSRFTINGWLRNWYLIMIHTT